MRHIRLLGWALAAILAAVLSSAAFAQTYGVSTPQGTTYGAPRHLTEAELRARFPGTISGINDANVPYTITLGPAYPNGQGAYGGTLSGETTTYDGKERLTDSGSYTVDGNGIFCTFWHAWKRTCTNISFDGTTYRAVYNGKAITFGRAS
jgi:hypothetical protein